MIDAPMARRVLGVAKRAELEALAGEEGQAAVKLAAEAIVLNIGELLLLSSDAHGEIGKVELLLGWMLWLWRSTRPTEEISYRALYSC